MDAAAMPGREHAIALERVSGRRPLLLLVSPFGAGRALVRATDPEEAMPCSATILRALYGLTSAEVEVANGLVRGATIEEIADARGTSVATARTQLKMLLAKTDTRRQAELVRLLLRLPRSSAS
jgi:DNA-binding CsgD family transcriptional regulator